MLNKTQDTRHKTILLTGATGFLGSHLLRYLLSNEYQVVILKRSFSSISRIEKELSNSSVKFYDIDVVDLEKIFIENKIDVVIHCATEYGRANNSCYKVLETNLMFPIKLLEFSIENNVNVFINTDSYFNKENMSYSYLLNYSLSKKSLNLWLKYFSKKIKIINVLLEHIYGPNDNPDKFVQKMIQSIAIDKEDHIDLTLGDQKRDFIYVDDVCKIYLSILKYAYENNFRYRTFDVGTGIGTTIKNFVLCIKEISKSKTKLNFGSIPYREDEIMCSYADTVELSNLVNICDLMDFKTGIKKIIDSVK